MYGIVNDAIQGLITKQFGIEAWEKVKKVSMVKEDYFVSLNPYPDHITYDMAESASKVLNIPLKDVLVAFGEYWILVTAQEKYGSMLQAGGFSLKEFLLYLPNLHNRISLIFHNMKQPEFQVSNVEENSLHVHYISEREGLKYFVLGLMYGLGKLYETKVEVEIIACREEGADHEIFHVSW